MPRSSSTFVKPNSSYTIPNDQGASTSSYNQNLKKQKNQKDFDERKAKNLCFKCDEPYSSTHRSQCKGRMFALEVLPDDENDEELCETVEEIVNERQGDDVYNSLNALSGLNAYQTMRVKGIVGKHVIHILIYSGSTHNFLDSTTSWVVS